MQLNTGRKANLKRAGILKNNKVQENKQNLVYSEILRRKRKVYCQDNGMPSQQEVEDKQRVKFLQEY